ncbi:hypothetical protein BBJ28_00013480 [Nothophytophthora sp. Chile5]|nr:hypothetical protein BBJ28_00013480 [Nothophytophthora sp. Chile5]
MTRDASRPLRHTQTRHAGAPAWLAITGALQLLVTLASPAVEAAVSELNCSLAAQAQDAAVTLTWQLLEGDGNFTRISHSSEALPAVSAAASDRLLVLGGIEYESAQPVVASPVLVFNVASNSFFSPQDQILSSVSTAYQATSVDAVFVSPASRVEHASFVHPDGAVFLFGGQSREFLNDTWRGCLDGSSTNVVWDQLVTATDAATIAATPVPRVGHSFTKVFENSSVIGALVFGGLSEDYVELGDLRLALIAKTSASARACSDRGPKLVWRVLQTTPLTDSGPVPQARAYHCAMTTSKLFTASKLACLVVYGGKSVQDNVIFDELWRLCPSTSSSFLSLPVERQSHTWELLSAIGTTPGARYGASMTFVDEGKVALAGGSYTFPNDFLNDVWELNVNATQWVRLSFTTDFSPPRRGHTLSFFSTSKRLFLFGGRDRYSVVQKRMEATDYDAPFCTIGFKITFCSATATYVCIPCPSGSYLESGTRNCLSAPVSGAMNSSASPTPAVLYFPASPLQVVNASVSSTAAAIEIQIARAGDLTSRLQATVAWGSSNFSSSSSLWHVSLDFAPGEEQKSISLPMAELSPRRGCRFFSLALEDLPGANPSVVSSDSDSEISVYLDDLNGVSGGNVGRSVTSVYTRQETGEALAVVALDRLVPTQVTLTSSSTVKDANLGAALRDQPLNLLVVIDPSASVAATVVAQLPAIVAELQSVYLSPSRGVRMGLMSGSSNGSAVFYHDLADFFDAARAFVGLNSSALEEAPLTWQWVADGLLGSSDAASWPSRDRRHLLVVGAEGLTANANTSTPSRLTDVLRGQNVFAFALSRTQTVFSNANDVMKGIQYGNATAAIPSLIRQAFQQWDAEMPPQVNVLADPVGLVASAQVWGFSAGPSSFPIIGVKLGSFPTPAQLKTVTSTAVVVGVPGMIQLSINVQEPGPACFPLMSPPSIDPLPLSGWADAWHLSTISEISRLWKSIAAPSTLEMALFQDASLLRTSTSTILSISDSNSMNLSLTRTFPGSYFAAGLSLVTRGYWRSAPSNAGAESATCSIQTHLTGVNASLKDTNTVSFPPHVVPGEWTYGFLQSIIPWELSNLAVTLVCNTSSPGVSVEWAALGLLPDPAFACTCPRGFYHDALAGASLSDGTCVRCAAGSYCAAGIKRQCPDGTFSFGKAASCESCRDGWICTDGLARLCEPGTYSTLSFTCGVCPSGYACRNGKKTMCPAGTFSLEQASDCQSCPPGTISRSDGCVH